MDIELITLVNSFHNTIALNNLLIKEKITRKLVIITNMYKLGLSIMNYSNKQGKRIIEKLQVIDKQGDIIKYAQQTNDSNQLLGDIIHNAYHASGYNLLLTNFPIAAVTSDGREFIIVDVESVYDTLDQITPFGIESVIQIASDTYLARFIDSSNAKYVSSVIHHKMISSNIITAEYIIYKPLHTNTLDSIDDIDGSVEDNKLPKQENKIYNLFNYVILKIISALKIF